MSSEHSTGSSKPLIIAIAIVLIAYLALALVWHLPQQWTAALHTHHGETAAAGDHTPEAGGKHAPATGDHTIEDSAAEEHEPVEAEATDTEHAPADAVTSTDHGEHAEAATHEKEEHPIPSSLYVMIVPFALLLLAIAVMPLIPFTEHWWEKNLNRFYVAALLGLITLAYFAFFHSGHVPVHWPSHGWLKAGEDGTTGFHLAKAVLFNAILGEYIPFIMLLFSLYTISGGIRIEGDLAAHPVTNSTFIAIGGLLASFIGTTGAAMLLIRPLLETNKERKHVRHTVVFFIFVVCNCGGCLLPIGDPPLFLGYLRGVSFMWTMNLWPAWLMVNILLILVYFIWDHFFCYPHETKTDILRDEVRTTKLRFSGLWPNVPLLLGVILSVALLDPHQKFMGTNWYPWMYLREIVQLALVGLSLLLGSQKVRKANNFNYHAIIEVAALFCGIFICMQPPLQILNEKGSQLGIDTPAKYFWATGSLSSVLDNAPTYVVFFETAKSLDDEDKLQHEPLVYLSQEETTGKSIPSQFLIAISLGAVFMGAMTYIGNGPNFMVRAIADKSGVKMPSFFGYMVYSCLILLPILVVTVLVMPWMFGFG